MKMIKTSAIGVLLSLCTLHAPAQENLPLNEPDRNKPHLFDDMPPRMELRISDLQPLFSQPTGASVEAFVADAFPIQGTLVSKSDARDQSLQTIVIRSTNRPGATLTLTRTVQKDGTARYSGRILSFRNSDAFEIVPVNGIYILQKKNLYDLVAE